MSIPGIHAGQALYGPTSTQKHSSRPVETSFSRTTATDSVNISEAARTMSRTIPGENIQMPTVGAGGVVRIEDVEAETKEALNAFQKDLNGLFAENGIDTNQAINISTDQNGNVIVTNDHPDKEKIEQVFENNGELANRYKGISNNMALIKAVEEASAFQKEYVIDPEAAVAKYSYLFDDNRNNDPYLNINGDRFSFEYGV